METEIKISVPEGYVIDKENSTFELIKFKKQEIEYPKTWDDLGSISGVWFDNYSEIEAIDSYESKPENKNIIPNEKLAQASLAQWQLLQLRKRFLELNGYDSEKDYQCCIFRGEDNTIYHVTGGGYGWLSFPTNILSHKFSELYGDYIEVAKWLL